MDFEVFVYDCFVSVVSNIVLVVTRRGLNGDLYVLDIGDGVSGRGFGFYCIGLLNLLMVVFIVMLLIGAVFLVVLFDVWISIVVVFVIVIAYEWDLDGNGMYEMIGAIVVCIYVVVGLVIVVLRVIDFVGC